MSVGIAEAVFRAAGKQPSDDMVGLYEPLGDHNYKCRSNAAVTNNWFSGPFDVYTDDLGLRSGKDGRGAVKAGGRIDILVLGDSQGFSQGVRYEDSIAGVLERIGAEHGYVVANASVGGHFLQNQFELVRWLRQQHRVKIGKLLVLATPRMIIKPDGYTSVYVDVDGRLYNKAPGTVVRLRAWLKAHSTAYVAVRDAFRSLAVSSGERPQDVRYYEAGPMEVTRSALLASQLRQLKEWVPTAGAETLLVYVPTVVEFDFDQVSEAATDIGASVSAEAPWRVLSAAGAQANAELIDLRPTLDRLKADGEPLHLKGDAHYSAALCRACGESIWAALTERGIVH